MKFIKKTMFFLFITFVFICIVLYVASLLPSPTLCKSNEITIFDQNQEILINTHHENEGEYLELSEINEEFLICFIASEDEDFYNHNGFSLKGIIRAIFTNVTTNASQGGSTISQQLSRSLFLDNEKSIIRKIKEALITINIESNYDKKEIIEQYLNNIYLGHNIYGIEQASKYYFNKSNKDLYIDEIALITGIANAPNINAPDINYENSIIRRNYVLKRLLDLNYINNELYTKLLKKETKININKIQPTNINTQLFNYIKNRLIKLNLYNKEILASGLNVYTTIDSEIQKQTYQIIQNHNKKDNSQIAVLILQPNTGNILSMFGGYNIDDQYNRAIYSQRPIGSTIKPLLYYLALKCNMTPLTFFNCNKMTFNVKGFDAYTPTNASNNYAKNKINMIEAIGLSDNIYATKTLLYIGFENFEKLLKMFNVDINCVLSSALGVDEMSLLKITSIYNCFASLGDYYTPRLISKITDKKGNILYKQPISGSTLLSKSYVKVLNQLLTSPFDKNLIDYTSPTLLNYQTNNIFAAKTGSNESNSYTIGFNPMYSIGVWIGTDNNEKLINTSIAKSVFQSIANTISKENIWYTPSNNIEIKTINPITGKYDNNGSTYWLIK